MFNDPVGSILCWAIWLGLLLAGLGVVLFLYWPEFGKK
jgi:hypothetical protein